MNLNDLLMLKILAFILCNNIWMRMVVLIILILDLLFKVGKIKKSKKYENVLVGCLIIFLNEILNVNLVVVNFAFLGVLSSFLIHLKRNTFIELYFLFVVIEGGVVFCLNL